jgi:hypothetical protein
MTICSMTTGNAYDIGLKKAKTNLSSGPVLVLRITRIGKNVCPVMQFCLRRDF